MKSTLFLLVALFCLTISLTAQRKCMVVKFNGDTSYYDELVAGGKTINCKNKGDDKVKLNASEVRYYTRPTKMWVQNDGEKSHEVDTVRKCVVSDGKIFIVEIENDSVYLVQSTEIGFETPAMDFHIIRKRDNTEVLEIKKTKAAIETLKKYFGGSCKVFDDKIVELNPKFQKAVFPYNDWYTLLYTYNMNCKK